MIGSSMDYKLPSGMLAVKFDDGTSGFLDPADGTYYDAQGNDVTGYVQNFGGAKILGPASAQAIAIAEGTDGTTRVPTPSPAQLPPGPSPRVSVPLSVNSAGMFLTASSIIPGVPNLVVLLAGAAAATMLLGSAGGRRR
jgi:hypothetical protein